MNMRQEHRRAATLTPYSVWFECLQRTAQKAQQASFHTINKKVNR